MEDPPVPSAAAVIGGERRVLDRPLLEEADRRDIGQRLAGSGVGTVEGALGLAEQVQRPDDRVAEPHGDRVDARVSAFL